MTYDFMKRIRNANTVEELKGIMVEVNTCYFEGKMSDEAFGRIYAVFTSKRDEF